MFSKYLRQKRPNPRRCVGYVCVLCMQGKICGGFVSLWPNVDPLTVIANLLPEMQEAMHGCPYACSLQYNFEQSDLDASAQKNKQRAARRTTVRQGGKVPRGLSLEIGGRDCWRWCALTAFHPL